MRGRAEGRLTTATQRHDLPWALGHPESLLQAAVTRLLRARDLDRPGPEASPAPGGRPGHRFTVTQRTFTR